MGAEYFVVYFYHNCRHRSGRTPDSYGYYQDETTALCVKEEIPFRTILGHRNSRSTSLALDNKLSLDATSCVFIDKSYTKKSSDRRYNSRPVVLANAQSRSIPDSWPDATCYSCSGTARKICRSFNRRKPWFRYICGPCGWFTYIISDADCSRIR